MVLLSDGCKCFDEVEERLDLWDSVDGERERQEVVVCLAGSDSRCFDCLEMVESLDEEHENVSKDDVDVDVLGLDCSFGTCDGKTS
mmetsp:Transcript_6153/g.12892  ORF Transcript_6153/g.12892 Transcript_6153/m.12892 type:complete len:86 (+) Transcript_6153:939-1196(+)